jgi:hypothetical protein
LLELAQPESYAHPRAIDNSAELFSRSGVLFCADEIINGHYNSQIKPSTPGRRAVVVL